MLRTLGRSKFVQVLVGETLAGYLALVNATSRLTCEPADYAERHRPFEPYIVAMWHGQHFMTPFVRPSHLPAKVMISRSRDGEINATIARRFGMGLIRASGGRTAAQIKKRGGARGFREAVRALENGESLAMTADIPKGPARSAGQGIVMLAQMTGRPIMPTAYASRRRWDLNSWDSASVNLPFSRAAFVVDEPVIVPIDTPDDELEDYRLQVERGLNRATERAYQIVDG
ncbi:MAG: lysophospholipid acyltransferase family protein [Pseudomonadota bacterium]